MLKNEYIVWRKFDIWDGGESCNDKYAGASVVQERFKINIEI